MTLQGVRRSGRLAKQVAVLLIGSDTEGRVFSEETKTVVLSRHGAGVLSRYKLAPEDEIVVRRLETGKEVEARIVGQIGSNAKVYTYGVAFVDHALDFWNEKFPPADSADSADAQMHLACSGCDSRATLDHSELEADVYAINDGIVRYCSRCGFSTVWKRTSAPQPARPVSPPPRPSPVAPVARSVQFSSTLPTEEPAAPSAYSSSAIALDDFPEMKPLPAPPIKPAVPAVPASPARTTPSVNRRKHARAKVTVAACVRTPELGDDVAICEDMSRGGIRFKSRKRYSQGATIEVAAPYSPEIQSIFVTGKIVFVQKIPDQDFFRYGVAYAPTKASR